MVRLHRLGIVLSASAVFVTHSAGQAGGGVTANSPEAQRAVVERCQSELRSAFKGFVVNVVADVKTSEALPRIQFINSEQARVWSESQFALLFGNMAHREVAETEDSVVLKRSADSIAAGDDLAIVHWLSLLQDSEVLKLCGSGAAYLDLSNSTQQMLARNVHMTGLQQAMAGGQFVSTSMRIQLFVNAQDSHGNPVEIPVDITARSSDREAQARAKTERNFKPPVPPKLTAKIPIGNLDFAEGQLLSLATIVDRASKVFHKIYLFDGRLGESMYYMQGHFSESSFLKSIAKVTEPIAIQEPDGRSAQRRKSMMNVLLHKVINLIDPSLAPKGLRYDEVLRGDKFSASDLMSADPGLRAGFQRNGIDPNAQFSLSAQLRIDLYANSSDATAPGQNPLGNDISIVFKQ